jgi:cytochrome oxidase assembly protein ShyY1
MVLMIGVVTMAALIWLLAWSLARESDAEKRSARMPSVHRPLPMPPSA